MIQSGGWCSVRAADEHTKLARAALDFSTDLDALFQINVTKMRAMLPVQLRTLIERPIQELCHRAETAYRKESDRPEPGPAITGRGRRELPLSPLAGDIGAAIMAAALDAGEHEPLGRIMDRLREGSPEVAIALGW
jgi:hypothetical protein